MVTQSHDPSAMFGTFPLILALAVAGYHADLERFGLKLGIAAVVNFYILSGFVTAALIQRYYAGLWRPTALFYLDRGLRVVPRFMFFLAPTWLFLGLRLIETRHSPGVLDAGTLLENVAIVPLNYHHYFSLTVLIPPSWSLALEIQFYALASVLAAMLTLRLQMVLVSLLIFALASLQIVDTDLLGYQLLPGVLYMFISGGLIYELRNGSREAPRVLLATVALVAALSFVALNHQHIDPFNRAVFYGYLTGVPALLLLSRLDRHRLDDALGTASYGAFLGHWLVIWWLRKVGVFGNDLAAFQVAVVVLAALVGWAGYLLAERPVLILRRSLRGRVAAASKCHVIA